jgi:hypothetical protein
MPQTPKRASRHFKEGFEYNNYNLIKGIINNLLKIPPLGG